MLTITEGPGLEPPTVRPLCDAPVGSALALLSKLDLTRTPMLRSNEPNAPLLPANRAVLRNDGAQAAHPDIHIQKLIPRIAQAQAMAPDGPTVELHDRVVEAVPGDVAMLQKQCPRSAPDVKLHTAQTPEATHPSLLDGVRDAHWPGKMQVGSQDVDTVAGQCHNADVQSGDVHVLLADQWRCSELNDPASGGKPVHRRSKRTAFAWHPHHWHLCIDHKRKPERTFCRIAERTNARRQVG
mmetsp:Transcript_13488/g.26529  ORF Transcript_13488/g.26529 Transcript_13488/m.26529 type:complete len:240 (+) Transcript_13488:173-892(+)